MGRGQVVRHQVLVLAFGGSNPSAPAKVKPGQKTGFYFGKIQQNNPHKTYTKCFDFIVDCSQNICT